MIRLTRDRSNGRIHAGFFGTKRAAKMLALLDGHLAGEVRFNNSWKDAKAQLIVEAAGKCAYCEADTTVVAHGDVEHFRPKSVYWWLAYCYENYVFACQVCNQVHKGDQFPIHGTMMTFPPIPPDAAALSKPKRTAIAALLCPDPMDDAQGHPMAKFLQAVDDEAAALVDPYLSDPEPLFKWVVDPVQRQVAIAARDSSQASQRAFEASERYLGLNRVELLRLRYNKYVSLEFVYLTMTTKRVPAPLRARAEDEARLMVAPDAPFAGMCRYFLRDVWKLAL